MSDEGEKTGRLAERRADFPRTGLSVCFAGGAGIAVFRAHGPVCGTVFAFFIRKSGRIILRLKRRVRPRGDPWSSGEILRNRGIRAGARLLRRGRAQPRALFWKGGESSSRFGHEKRDGPQKARPACFSAAGPDYFQLPMLQSLTRSRSSAALPSLKRSRVPTR